MAGPSWDDTTPSAAEQPTWDNTRVYVSPGKEPADHGLSERQKLSPLGKALSPVTGYWDTYQHMNKEAQDQVAHGYDQLGKGPWETTKGVGNIVGGSLGYVTSPINAAYRSVVGQPVEDVTGIPREYTEFAAQLATPGIGFSRLPKAPGEIAEAVPKIRTVEGPDLTSPTALRNRELLDEFNIPGTRGQVTEDAGALRFEDMAARGAFGDKMQNIAKPAFEDQYEAIQSAGRRVGQTVGRGEQPLDTPANAAVSAIEEVGNRAAAARDIVARGTAEAERDQAALRARSAQTGDDITDRIVAGRGQIENPRAAGEIANQEIRQAAQDNRAQFNNLYDRFGRMEGSVPVDEVRGLGTTVRETLTNRPNPVIVDEATPNASSAIQMLDRESGGPTLTNRAAPRMPMEDGTEIVGVTLQGMDRMRRHLRMFYNRAQPGTEDRRAVAAIIHAFDDQIERTISSGLFSGDPRALETLQAARASYAQYRRNFHPGMAGDDVGTAMRRIVERNATPEETANMIVGSGKIGNAGLPVRLADRLENVLGVNSESWNAIRQAIWQKASQVRSGAAGDVDAVRSARSIMDFVDSSLARRMFSPDELGAMRAHARGVQQLEAAVEALPSVQRAERIQTIYQQAFGGEGLSGSQRQVFQRMVDGTAQPEEVAQAMFSIIGGGNPANASRAIAAVERIVGPDSPVMGAVRQGVWQKLTQNPFGKDAQGQQKLVQGINEFLNGKGRGVARQLYSAEERAMMQRYADAVRTTIIGRYSRTNSDTAIAQGAAAQKKVEAIGSAISSFFHLGPIGHFGGNWVTKKIGERMKSAAGARTEQALRDSVYDAVPPQPSWAVGKPVGAPSAVRPLALPRVERALDGSYLRQLQGTVPAAADKDQQQGERRGNDQPDQNAGGKAHGGPVARAAGGVVHNHNPTEAQKKAGNYAKTHKFFQGLDITLENLKGKARSGIGRDGKKWSVKMPADYGYIKRTEGADGDHVDVYLGPNDKSDQVFVVDQKDAETGKFDEHKCLLGFSSEKEARATYRAGFSDGKDRIKHLRRMSMAQFREWLSKGDTSKEIRRYAKGGAVNRAVQAIKDYSEGGAAKSGPFGYGAGGSPTNPALWDVPEEELPQGSGMGPIARGIGHIAKSVFWDTPKSAIDAAKETPYGLRREDFTDVPPDRSPDPDSPLGGVGIRVPRGAGSHLDPMIRPALEAGLNVMGGTALSAPKGATGAGPVVRRGLDMSEDARMARAAEQGFNTDKVWYHSALQPIEQFDKYGAFMGRSGTTGIHLTDNPKMASRYLDRYGEVDYKGEPFNKNIMPVYVRPGKVLERQEPFRSEVPMGHPIPEGYQSPVEKAGYDALMRQDAINSRGEVKHVSPTMRGAISGQEMVLTDPSRVRSVFAAFDPENKGKGILLGAGAGDKRGAVAAAAPMWRSAVEDAVETLPMKSAPADQWANTLRNVPGARGVARRVAEEAGSAVGNVAKRSTEIPNIREMATDEAIKVARKEPHLIKAGDQSEGFYVGAPREVKAPEDLERLRKAFDDYVAADARGGDWYSRYRRALNEVTGGNRVHNKWMSNQEGQWSAGVSPEGEFGFALKENNAEIAGMPVKSARPAQHEAHQRAIEAKDPSKYQLGDKTGEYAQLINPDRPKPPGATGVNDFRHARNWGYTEASGESQRDALTAAQHKFLDMETALAVDRANKAKLGGRDDWSGEQIQAAPWVRQKALSLMERNPNLTYEEAFARANTTIGDYFGKHTAFATHEAMPGADTGHLPGSITASAAEREAFSRDPRSTWATAPGGRDAIYSGMGIEGTGNYMRVRPTTEMQGLYTPPGGATETNVGWTARPLVAFDSGKTKSVAPADRALLDAGEATRGYIDAQNASAWHKPWAGGAPGESNSLFMPMDRKATAEELLALQKETGAHGLSDVVDTGKGVTATRFYPPPEDIGKAIKKGGLTDAIRTALPDARMPERVKVDSGYIDYTPKWQEGVGSGAATREMLEQISKTPRLRAAMSNNPDIPKAALARLERDEEWAGKWGATREDIQNARRIIGKGTGWVERLEAALKAGALLPAAALAVFGTAAEEAFPERS